MTVRELRAELNKFDPESDVWIPAVVVHTDGTHEFISGPVTHIILTEDGGLELQ